MRDTKVGIVSAHISQILGICGVLIGEFHIGEEIFGTFTLTDLKIAEGGEGSLS